MKTLSSSLTRTTLCGIAALALVITQADATVHTLTDGTSTAVYDPTTIGGMTDWNVGGADHLKSQSFWVRTGTDTQEIALKDILLSSSGSGNTADASFGVAGVYSIDISYELNELSIDSAQILESISIQNLSAGSLDLSFYQYNNFDLAANQSDDYARILTDTEGAFTLAQQIELGTGGISEEATVQNSPGSMFAEVAYFDVILQKLTDSDIDNLNNMTGTVGPGDVEFAFQWNYSLAAGQTELISKVKTLDVTFVPEPATLGLTVLGLGAILFSRRRRV